MLQVDMCKVEAKISKLQKQPVLTNHEAINYLFKNVLSKNKKNLDSALSSENEN
jgi:hypothetical protein